VVFLAKEWKSFHLFGKKLDYLHLKDFLKYECELYLKQPLTPRVHHNTRSVLLIAPQTIDLPLKLDDGRVIPVSRDTRLCHFCSYNVIENEAYFVLECPLYNPIRDKFPSQFKNVVPSSLKLFFQLNQ
jgi:hypothetical protein